MTQAAVNDDDEEGTGRVDWNSASRPYEILILIYYRDSTVLMIRQYISPSGTSTFYYTILIHHGKVFVQPFFLPSIPYRNIVLQREVGKRGIKICRVTFQRLH